MNFFVYELEPLVRDDIIETIKDAFSGITHVVEDLSDLRCALEQNVSKTVVILSVSTRDVRKRKTDVLSFAGNTPIVVICDDPPSNREACASAHFVSRPFDSQTLISAITNALSFQPKDPS